MLYVNNAQARDTLKKGLLPRPQYSLLIGFIVPFHRDIDNPTLG